MNKKIPYQIKFMHIYYQIKLKLIIIIKPQIIIKTWMIRQVIKWKYQPILTLKNTYNKSSFQKIVFFIQRLLNKISNQDNRTLRNNFGQREQRNLPAQSGQQKPKNAIQAEKFFHQNQQQIAAYEKKRLARIDDILSTKTYFHQTKIYQQRVGYDSMVQISALKQKHAPPRRSQVDFLNPQLQADRAYKRTRKYYKMFTNLKKYPIGNVQLSVFQQKQSQKNQSLINFLAQQALYTNFSLGQLKFTIQSIIKQKLLIEKDGIIVDLEQQQNQFYHKGQVYFKPKYTMSIYRMDIDKFNKKLVNQLTSLSVAIQENIGNIQQVISLDQIYQCLKNYYYDERVHDYLSKIENDQLDYFFSNLQISPDGKDMIVIIDLLDTKKQFVGLFKRIGQAGLQIQGIMKQNIIFNIRQQVTLRNNGQLYYIQRSQQGLFTQFTKTLFNTNFIKQNKQAKQVSKSQHVSKLIQQINRKDQILYRCKPYQQLKILAGKQAQISTANINVVSSNIILQQTDVGTYNNNRLYLILHGSTNNKQGIDMQPITGNNSSLAKMFEKQKVKQRFDYIKQWETSVNKLYSQCFQIFDVGYLIVRYCFVDNQIGSYLKYGNNNKFAKYISFIPYKGYKKGIGKQITLPKLQGIKNLTQLKQNSELRTSSQSNQKAPINKTVPLTNIQQFQLILPSEQSVVLLRPGSQDNFFYELDLDEQKILFASPQNHYITNVQVKHSSLSNIYLLVNHSIQSIYNRNSLYVHSLRRGILPYSIYLDGYPVEITNKNIGSGDPGKLYLRLQTPLLPVNLQYTLWKKEVKQVINNRFYTQTITIKQRQECDIVIKLISSSKYIQKQRKQQHELQPVILYLPSKDQKMDEIIVQKTVQKGTVLIQIINCRGIFGSNMIQLLRGTKQFYANYIQDIYQTIMFIKQNIGQRVSIYAQGPSSCLATFLLNMRQNQQNQLFDCSVLHQGLYDLTNITKQCQYFFGNDASIFKHVNPMKIAIFNPTKPSQKNKQSQDQQGQQQQQKILNLSNMLFTSLQQQHRVQSRKIINKLRTRHKIIYDTIYLKQFDSKQQKDVFNIAYLYQIMNKKIHTAYATAMKNKRQKNKQEGQANSRHYKDIQFKERKNKNMQDKQE